MLAVQVEVEEPKIGRFLAVASSKEEKVDPMWSADEDDRRRAIALRAAAGARRALAGK
jgi:hypothetical protein